MSFPQVMSYSFYISLDRSIQSACLGGRNAMMWRLLQCICTVYRCWNVLERNNSKTSSRNWTLIVFAVHSWGLQINTDSLPQEWRAKEETYGKIVFWTLLVPPKHLLI